MDVYTKYFRRLLQGNAAQVFPGSSRNSDSSGSYPLLVAEVQKITQDPQQAQRIAESIDTPEGDLFRDFDLSTFMEHFKLDPLAKTTLALACKGASKPDLRTKGEFALGSLKVLLLTSRSRCDSVKQLPKLPDVCRKRRHPNIVPRVYC